MSERVAITAEMLENSEVQDKIVIAMKDIAMSAVESALKEEGDTCSEDFCEFEIENFYKRMIAIATNIDESLMDIEDDEMEEIKSVFLDIFMDYFCMSDIPNPFYSTECEFHSYLVQFDIAKEWEAWWFIYDEQEVAYCQARKKGICV